MRIWKYPLEVVELQEVKMPMGALTLSVQLQAGAPCLWAVVPEDETRMEVRRIAIYGTGSPILHELRPFSFLGTFQYHHQGLVFHAFEIRS